MTKTILVADDSKTMQKIVELAFRTTEFSVVKASNAEEALRRAGRANPDVILADTQMPDKDGYALCEALRGNPATAGIPVLLLCGNFEQFDEARARAVQANGHIKKPFDSQSLINQVSAAVGASTQAAQPMSFAATLAAKQHGSTPEPVAAANPLPVRPAPAPVAPPPPAPPPPAPAPRTPTPAPAMSASPFTAPRIERPAPTPAPAAHFEDEPMPAYDDEPMELPESEVEEAEAQMLRGPALEPPRPPSPEQRAQAAKVDMWSMAEHPSDEDVPIEDAEPYMPSRPAPPPPRPAPSAAPMAQAAARVADAAAGPVAAAVAGKVPELPREEIVRLAREVIERVVWEVVPDLAETIIREEIRRLTQSG